MKWGFSLVSCLLSMTLVQSGAFSSDDSCKFKNKRPVIEKKVHHKKKNMGRGGCGCGGGGGGVKTEELPPDEIKE